MVGRDEDISNGPFVPSKDWEAEPALVHCPFPQFDSIANIVQKPPVLYFSIFTLNQ